MGEYRSFSITRKGAKHGEEASCQDASVHQSVHHRDGPGPGAEIAVVADGHGSTRCFRSDIGSKKAVEIAQKSVEKFVKETSQLPGATTVQFIDRREIEVSESKIALSSVVREIIDKWFVAVIKDEKEHPLTDDPRLEEIAPKYKDRYINDDDYRCHAYGTTLMVAVRTENYWFGFQVGDGQCVVLYADGLWRRPIPWDDRCAFNTTTSICDDDSLSGFRYWFGFGNPESTYTEYGYGVNGQDKDYVREIKSPPLAIFIGSDGVEDSYPRVDNDKYVVNFYRNRVVSLAENGFAAFNEEIDGLAKRFADRESTDDVSIAGIIGDVGKADVAKMKQDTAVHEAGERASAKRRDADEKKEGLDTVQKRMDAVTANQRQTANRMAAAEKEAAALSVKKADLAADLAKEAAEIEDRARAIKAGQNKLRERKRDRLAHEHEEKSLSAQTVLAESDAQKANKAFESVRKKYAKQIERLQRLQKMKDANNNYPRKRTPGKPQMPVRSVSGPLRNQVNGAVTDTKAEGLRQKIEKAVAKRQALRDQLSVSQQRQEEKARKLSALKNRLWDIQQCIRQAEGEIKQAEQDCNAAETLNRKQQEAVRKLRHDLAEIKREIRSKQAETAKLSEELETLNEQTEKQTATFTKIKSAWEQAEAEAQALETTVQNNSQIEVREINFARCEGPKG